MRTLHIDILDEMVICLCSHYPTVSMLQDLHGVGSSNVPYDRNFPGIYTDCTPRPNSTLPEGPSPPNQGSSLGFNEHTPRGARGSHDALFNGVF